MIAKVKPTSLATMMIFTGTTLATKEETRKKNVVPILGLMIIVVPGIGGKEKNVNKDVLTLLVTITTTGRITRIVLIKEKLVPTEVVSQETRHLPQTFPLAQAIRE